MHPFIRRNFLAFCLLVSALALLVVVLVQKQRVDEAFMALDSSNRKVIELQLQMQQVRDEKQASQQALQECQQARSGTGNYQELLPGLKR